MTLWFRAKSYGWGWTPVTVQGWLVTAAFLVALLLDSAALIYRLRTGAPPRAARLEFYLVFAVSFAVFLLICWKKGERPRWRWGR